MFGLMKHFLKEKNDPPYSVTLSDMHVGCVVGFGFMPQKNINGRRFPVTEINSYLFDTDSFLAYRLKYSLVDVNIIIAEGGRSQDAYLALSQLIEERLISPLFSSCHPRGWLALKEGDRITVNHDTLGAPAGWLARHYKVAMITKGRILEGDFRLRKPSSYPTLARLFDYALLVDDANEHALEVESYEDGTFRVFSTVYRPATDIGEINRPPVRLISSGAGQVNSVLQRQTRTGLKLAMPTKNAWDEIEHQPIKHVPLANNKKTQKEDNVVTFPTLPNAKNLEENTVPQEAVASVHEKFGRIKPSSSPTSANDETLACDIKLAGLIIEEAQRNQLLMSELIRKVIDLPARVEDHILIPFALSDAEYGELARRYNLQSSDHNGVRQRILEELRQFAGVKTK